MKRMKRKVAVVVLACMVALLSVSASAIEWPGVPSVGTPAYGITTAEQGTKIRTSASETAGYHGILQYKDYAHVVGVSGSWYLVQYDLQGNTGYVLQSDIGNLQKHYGQVNSADGAVFMSAPNSSAVAIGVAENNKALPYIMRRSNWTYALWGIYTGYFKATEFTV